MFSEEAHQNRLVKSFNERFAKLTIEEVVKRYPMFDRDTCQFYLDSAKRNEITVREIKRFSDCF